MALYRDLLLRPHLSLISAEPDLELDRLARTITPSVRIAGRHDLELLLGRLLDVDEPTRTSVPKTLDLLGHSTPSTALLQLGDWVIDASSPTVTAFFRELSDHDVLSRLGIDAVRLLACRSADTGSGRATICALANLLGVEVYGTNHLLYDTHHDEHGFRDAWNFLLVGSSDLKRTTGDIAITLEPQRWPRRLDIDALPALPLGSCRGRWPRRLATPESARRILQLLHRDAGAQMPGLLATPSCELALPSVRPGEYHVAQVLLDGAFVRFHPDGPVAPGVMYPVGDAQLLRQLVDELSAC